jgi:hypothetical protein
MVQTSQHRPSYNSLIVRNPISEESLHHAACRRFWYPWSEAGVWVAPVVMSNSFGQDPPQVPLVDWNEKVQTFTPDATH